MLRGIVVLTLIGVTLSSDSANQYVDDILQTSFPEQLKYFRLDSAHLPEFKVKFGRMGSTRGALAHFRQGKASGFNRIARRTDCLGPREVTGLGNSINCTLTLFPFVTNYYVNVSPDTDRFFYPALTKGHVGETLIDVKIIGDGNGRLMGFDVIRLGDINVTYDFIDEEIQDYANRISDEYKKRVSVALPNVLYKTVKFALKIAFESKPLPRP